MNAPHFEIPRPPLAVEGRSVSWQEFAQLVTRGANCLEAALASPTAEAGLNEPRVAVLEALDLLGSGSCSQAELASRLLQSESNLSTLLERMRQDGLIDRDRSSTDRRKSLIRLTGNGFAALNTARAARSAAVARWLKPQAAGELNAPAALLVQMIQQLEVHLEVGSVAMSRSASIPSQGRFDEPQLQVPCSDAATARTHQTQEA